ncbi:uncharacterized protein LOC129585812 [Paramacrobiotus metropolitanus]|uniref:uncharacterized protein LOC129585812 n=1 Tax=Paramacrobiotus metropolitanus TaxID=2943436 RepID=UPI002446243C|nr:uncharacterized protein LOC129585812 [Paramacrobiotus metropolitanus]
MQCFGALSLFLVLSVGYHSVHAAGILDSIKNVFGISSNKEQIVVPSGGERLPNYYRIEALVVRLENQAGIKSNGGSCDTFGKCDPIVYAYIDTDKPTNTFPGSLDVKAIPKIFETTNNNSPDINYKLTKDICNKDPNTQKAMLRVHVTDHNTILSNSLISDFDCPLGGTLANEERSATWQDAICTGKYQEKKIRLSARVKMYRVPQNDCTNARPQGEPAKKS